MSTKSSTPTKLQIDFGNKIKRERENRKLTQEDLEEKTGLDRTYISGIERGIRNPSLINIGKIAKALRISLDELFSF